MLLYFLAVPSAPSQSNPWLQQKRNQGCTTKKRLVIPHLILKLNPFRFRIFQDKNSLIVQSFIMAIFDPSWIHQWPSRAPPTQQFPWLGFPHHLIHFIQSFPILHGHQLSIRETSLQAEQLQRLSGTSEHQGVSDKFVEDICGGVSKNIPQNGWWK